MKLVRMEMLDLLCEEQVTHCVHCMLDCCSLVSHSGRLSLGVVVVLLFGVLWIVSMGEWWIWNLRMLERRA